MLQSLLNHKYVKEAIQKYNDFSNAVGKAVMEGKEAVIKFSDKAIKAVKSGVEKAKEKIVGFADSVKEKFKSWFGWRLKKNIKNLRLKKFKVNSKARL